MQDIQYILQWWITILFIGLIFLPFTHTVFHKFVDSGYLFSKVLGFAFISYFIFFLNVTKIVSFNFWTVIFCIFIFLLINIVIAQKNSFLKQKLNLKIIFFEEFIFFAGLFFWSFIRAHEPSINGLEKFMDFGFVNSIIRTDFQPAIDMWFTPLPINYYYFGHLTTAVITKVSLLPSYATYNLMIATLFAFTLALGFSLGLNFLSWGKINRKSIIGGLLSGILLAFGGNLHTIYSLFKPYNVDSPVTFFSLPFSPLTIPNEYWYPNATRFIPLTIHEFPIYSFVVSDLHGHVIDIMYVLLSIALIFVIFKQEKVKIVNLVLLSFLISVMYMTNAWDSAIYLLLFIFVILIKNLNIFISNMSKFKFLSIINKTKIFQFLTQTSKPVILVTVLFVVFSLPFNLNFKPFAEGVGFLCSPEFLTNLGKVGPLLFEADHCQRSSLWQLIILYGFFYFFVISFIGFIAINKTRKREDIFILALILVSTLLIIIPEFIYVRDIYPAHYRANTMFKLVYQAFMMLMLVSVYSLTRIITSTRNLIFIFISLLFLVPVIYYPYLAINSYYGELKNYRGLNGIAYLKDRYPEDFEGINFINKQITGRPVIVEAQGDSYTDYARISANTGLPTILGWTVHEWLWRGTYDIPAPRIAEVKDIYESPDINSTIALLRKYNAEYVYLGNLEYQKYPNLIENKFEKIGEVIFESNGTKIYKLSI